VSKKVEILLYDGVNEAEVGILYEILATAEIVDQAARTRQRGFIVDTVADRISAITTANDLKMLPHKGVAGSLGANVLIIPGGPGARKPNIPKGVVDWLTRAVGVANVIASSSTGVYILGRAGLINNRRVTTHYTLLDDLKRVYPRAEIESSGRVTADGKNLLTSAGGTGAIDLALEIVFRNYGPEVALRAAHRVEYPYSPPEPKKTTMTVPDLSKPDW
jgi:transcriptional regulator GlxA family with amidase domain